MLAAVRRSRGSLTVGHVLRYTPFFSALHELLASGRLGDLVSIEHREDAAYWHTAHSFVRGNWARAAESTPMIVQKCCHDFDLLAWNLEAAGDGVRATRMQSFGSRLEFRPERAPAGASERCVDPCPAAPGCPYDARRLYLDMDRTGWPIHTISDDLSPEGRMRALREGPYGRCVYTAGSDAVDHQIAAMELSSGAAAVLVMNGHAARQSRTALYHGTRGTVRAVFDASAKIEFTDRKGGGPAPIPFEAAPGGARRRRRGVDRSLSRLPGGSGAGQDLGRVLVREPPAGLQRRRGPPERNCPRPRPPPKQAPRKSGPLKLHGCKPVMVSGWAIGRS